MPKLHAKLAEMIPQLRKELSALVKEHGDKVISEVSVSQAIGGLRGVKGMLCDTSTVEPDVGLVIRNIPIAKLADKLPEEVFYLLCTGELPNAAMVADLQAELRARARVPDYVWSVLKAMPADSHPMTMYSAAILAMERESVFRGKYDEMRKDEYWEAILEDSLQLIARVPAVAAGIYSIHYRKGELIPSNSKLDWAADFAQMFGLPDPTGEFANLMRLYLTLHSDHGGGNVSSYACHTVGSALSDPYYAVSAGMNGLAGPLHGLANQECLGFVLDMLKKFNGVPSDEQLRQYAWDTLNSGRVIPGYGHAVLRITDPRFDSFHEFGKRVCSGDKLFKAVDAIFRVVPGVLKEQGKAKDPWPNVDAISGSLLYHFGLTEFDFYTVLFGVSRVLGMCAQTIISRALGIPITRPKAVTTDQLKSLGKSAPHAA